MLTDEDGCVADEFVGRQFVAQPVDWRVRETTLHAAKPCHLSFGERM